MNESSVPANHDEKLGPGRIVATIVLALIALVCFGETARYLTAQQHHSVRIVGSFILGVVFAIGAWFALRYQSLAAEEAREAERIAAAQAVSTDAVPDGAVAEDAATEATVAADDVTGAVLAETAAAEAALAEATLPETTVARDDVTEATLAETAVAEAVRSEDVRSEDDITEDVAITADAVTEDAVGAGQQATAATQA